MPAVGLATEVAGADDSAQDRLVVANEALDPILGASESLLELAQASRERKGVGAAMTDPWRRRFAWHKKGELERLRVLGDLVKQSLIAAT